MAWLQLEAEISGPVEQTLAVAFDGSDGSRRALDAGIAEARFSNCDLVVIVVAAVPFDPSSASFSGIAPMDEATRQLRRGAVPPSLEPIIEEAERRASADGVTPRVLFGVGDAAQKIADLAERSGATRLFLGQHHHRLLDHVTGGDTVEAVQHRAQCEVVVVE